MMNNETRCLEYWDLCSSLTIEAIVALWCNAQPQELASLGFSTHCMDAKREAIINALLEGRLEYDRNRTTINGLEWISAGLEELIHRDVVRIKKDSLRRWFLDMPIKDRPAFLFEESRQDDLLPDGGDVAEMNSMRALAVMAWILSGNKTAYKIGDKPNKSKIGEAVEPLAQIAFGDDVIGFKSFHKKLAKALDLFDEEVKAKKLPWLAKY